MIHISSFMASCMLFLLPRHIATPHQPHQPHQDPPPLKAEVFEKDDDSNSHIDLIAAMAVRSFSIFPIFFDFSDLF